MATIDLNSDLGENTPDRVVADDAEMLRIVTSANVACGFHAGNPVGIRATLAEAAAHGVTVGAHPGYRDYENFGRVAIDIDDATLQADVEYQLGALQGLAASVGVPVKYVKPHGALYNTIAKDAHQAKIVAAAIRAIDPSLVVLALAGGVSAEVSERAGLTVAREAFADRAYEADGSLMSRTKEGSVLHDPKLVAERMLGLVHDGVITAADGTQVRLQADSICVHGDSAGAIQMAASVRAELTAAGIELAPFAK
ncbi:LamB/YcsF family protein [Gulosibacter faecalis]|uniref:LamB/YcsF family protein n=1 Tax=Gulosibacter faecalis TaxID=272240 RepID=A0ABW5UXE7_9MICO|nr:5-oxoprolinase subunit PxpA [Gulosibacter faecalis]